MFKLLIADDEQLEREALRFIISKSIDSIIDIEEAVNGREAIAKVQASHPDIIILDINMPGINGIEAAWKIREKDKSVCIIFLTAFHQFDYAHEAIKVGVEDYIVKPSSETATSTPKLILPPILEVNITSCVHVIPPSSLLNTYTEPVLVHNPCL